MTRSLAEPAPRVRPRGIPPGGALALFLLGSVGVLTGVVVLQVLGVGLVVAAVVLPFARLRGSNERPKAAVDSDVRPGRTGTEGRDAATTTMGKPSKGTPSPPA